MAKPKQFTTPAKGVSASKLARELGISVSSVSQKRQRGKTDKQIRDEAKQWSAKQERLSKRRQAKPTTPVEGELVETFVDAQLRKERALADKHELDVQTRKSELVELAAVNGYVSQMIVAARDILAKIAPELSDRLAAESSPVRVREMIEAEVSRALTRLSLFTPKV